jgi:hypothetical protein
MNKFTRILTNILKRGGLAFTGFPASMTFAVLLAGLTIWMVQTEPQTNMKLLIALQITCITSSIVAIALSVLARTLTDSRRMFALGNLLSLLFAVGAFLGLFLLGRSETDPSMRVVSIVFGAAFISLAAFLVIPTLRSTILDYNKMFFMTIKAFFIAVLYTGVLMGGFSFVAFAVQRLLLPDLNEKVYLYIVILSVLIGYAFFLGYFPNFRRAEDEEFLERAQIAIKQPRFAEVLFQNIMIPIHSALSLVLLIWSIRIVLTRVWPSYEQIIGIFTAYALFSIVLYLLVSSYDNKVVRWYRRIVPIATLVFLAFEIYPIYTKLRESGLMVLEYAVLCVWIYAAVVSACFIVIPIVKNRIASYAAAALVLLFVLPGIGALDASYGVQSMRLRNALTRNEMLTDGLITPSSEVSKEDKIIITEAVDYLYNDDDKGAPDWISDQMNSTVNFNDVFGFNQLYRYDTGIDEPDDGFQFFSIRLLPGVVGIDGYEYFISRDAFYNTEKVGVSLDGSTVDVAWQMGKGSLNAPLVRVTKGGDLLFDVDMKDIAMELYDEFLGEAPGGGKEKYLELMVEDMSFERSGGGVTIRILVDSVEFSIEDGEIRSIVTEIRGIYVK